MLSSLKLFNWRSHEKSVIDFSRGCNLIVGIMGAGKTSVVDAVCFALFGQFPALNSRKLKLEEVVRRGEKEASVELNFVAEGNNYSVFREIGRVAKATLRCNGNVIEMQPERVTEHVERILKIDYDLFSRAVYSEQNRIDYFLTLNKGERKKQIDELLGLDKFEIVRSNAVSLQNKFKSRVLEFKATLQFADKSRLESEAKEVEESLQRTLKLLESLSAEEVEVLSQFSDAEAKISVLEESERNFSQLNLQIQSKGAVLSHLAREFEGLKTKISDSEVMEDEGVIEKAVFELEAKKKLFKQVEQDFSNWNLIFQRLSSEKQAIMFELDALKAFSTNSLAAENAKILSLSNSAVELKRELSSLNSEVSKKTSLHLFVLQAIADLEKKELDRQANLREVEAIQGSILQYSGVVEKLAAVFEEKSLLQASIAELELGLRHLHESSLKCIVCDADLDSVRKGALLQEKLFLLEKKKVDYEALLKAELGLKLRADEKFALEKRLGVLTGIVAESFSEKLVQQRDKGAGIAAELNALSRLVGEKSESLQSIENRLVEAKELAAKISAFERLDVRLKNVELGLEKHFASKPFVPSPEDISHCDATLDKFLLLREAASKKKGVEKLTGEVNHLKGLIKSLNFDPINLSNEKSRRNSIEIKKAELNLRKSQLLKESASTTEALHRLKLKLDGIAEKEVELGNLEKIVSELSVFQNSVSEVQLSLRSELIRAVNEAMSSIFPRIYPYSDFSGVQLNFEEDYGLELKSAGQWVRAECCSGGERSAASLALRIAFSMVLTPNLSWLILDEPTHNLDEETVKLFSNAMESLESILSQVVIITHDEVLREGHCSKLIVVERNKQKGEASRISCPLESRF